MKSSHFVGGVLAVFFACGSICTAATGFQLDAGPSHSSAALEAVFREIFDALKTNDGRKAERLMRGLILENDSTWFTIRFGAEVGELVRAAYKKNMKDFVRTTRSLYAEDVRRGPIRIRVNRYDDASRAPELVPEFLRSMNSNETLYEVSVNGPRPSFRLVTSLTSIYATAKLVAGDLEGYFIETSSGFRFVPSNVLLVAVQEQQKKNYEIVARDPAGRPSRVRLPSIVLDGLTINNSLAEYPSAARNMKIEGSVVVIAVVGTKGRVRDVTVISGPQELHRSTIEAVSRWRFKPFRLDGRAVEIEWKYTQNYNLTR